MTPRASASLRPVSWARLADPLARARAAARLAPALRRILATGDRPFLPDLPERSRPKRAGLSSGRAGDPVAGYWEDLRGLPPTRREEEFALARARDLLQQAILDLAGERPHPWLRALAEEYLTPWSPVLEGLRERSASPLEPPPADAVLTRLRQRLTELRRVQEALVAGSLHRVPAVAGRYRNLGVPWEDLIQEGSAALLRAAERFDLSQGVRFAHYAQWWIQQGILKALSHQSRTVRLPVYLAQALHRVREAEAQSPAPLSARELAKRTRLKVEHVERARSADHACLSLDRTPLGEDGEECFAHGLADPRPAPEVEPVDPAERRAALEEALATLPAREARILVLRYGLDGKEGRTLEEIRKEMGVSRERVRQLLEQALGRLARPERKRALARFV